MPQGCSTLILSKWFSEEKQLETPGIMDIFDILVIKKENSGVIFQQCHPIVLINWFLLHFLSELSWMSQMFKCFVSIDS